MAQLSTAQIVTAGASTVNVDITREDFPGIADPIEHRKTLVIGVNSTGVSALKLQGSVTGESGDWGDLSDVLSLSSNGDSIFVDHGPVPFLRLVHTWTSGSLNAWIVQSAFGSR